jgi:hypothetical protein
MSFSYASIWWVNILHSTVFRCVQPSFVSTGWSQRCHSFYTSTALLLSRQQTAEGQLGFSNGDSKWQNYSDLSRLSEATVNQSVLRTVYREGHTKDRKSFNEVFRRPWSPFRVAYSQWPALDRKEGYEYRGDRGSCPPCTKEACLGLLRKCQEGKTVTAVKLGGRI